MDIPYDQEFNFGTGSFTIDFWVNMSIAVTTGRRHMFFSQRTDDSNMMYIGYTDDQNPNYVYFANTI
jgi:hypothetical protein